MKRIDKPPVGKPFLWKNGPLTGQRIKVKKSVLNGRGWSEDGGEFDVCESDIIPKLTGTIGPLCTLAEANQCLYPGVHNLRTSSPLARPYEKGEQYLVIWDRRPDEEYPVVDSYYEGELREFAKIICKVDSWKELRRR